jgi:hypothetical protein
MTVKELINHLQQFNQDLPVVIEHLTPEWNYTWDLESRVVYEDKEVSNDDGDLEYPKAVVINGCPFIYL